MIRRLRAFAAFWYDFVVGDDWVTAAGVALALALTAGLSHAGLAAWWLPPVAVLLLLPLGVLRAARRVARSAGRADRPDDAGH